MSWPTKKYIVTVELVCDDVGPKRIKEWLGIELDESKDFTYKILSVKRAAPAPTERSS